MPNPATPQSWNRYGYVKNNPINFNDPTGHKEDGECGLLGQDCGIEEEDDDENGPVQDTDEDSEEENEALQQLQFCLNHQFAPECDVPSRDTLSPFKA